MISINNSILYQAKTEKMSVADMAENKRRFGARMPDELAKFFSGELRRLKWSFAQLKQRLGLVPQSFGDGIDGKFLLAALWKWQFDYCYLLEEVQPLLLNLDWHTRYFAEQSAASLNKQSLKDVVVHEGKLTSPDLVGIRFHRMGKLIHRDESLANKWEWLRTAQSLIESLQHEISVIEQMTVYYCDQTSKFASEHPDRISVEMFCSPTRRPQGIHIDDVKCQCGSEIILQETRDEWAQYLKLYPGAEQQIQDSDPEQLDPDAVKHEGSSVLDGNDDHEDDYIYDGRDGLDGSVDGDGRHSDDDGDGRHSDDDAQ